MTKAYMQGFLHKCAEYDIDGRPLLKEAISIGGGIKFGKNFIKNLSGSRVGALEKRLASTHKNFWGKHFIPGEGGGAIMAPSTSELLGHTNNVAKLTKMLETARQAQFQARLGLGIAGAGAAGYALG